MSKLNVVVSESYIDIDQGSLRMKIPRAFLLDFLQPLMREETAFYYHGQKVTFEPRSCIISNSLKAGEPTTVAVIQRKSVPQLVLGLIPHIEQSYVGKSERLEIDDYIKKHT